MSLNIVSRFAPVATIDGKRIFTDSAVNAAKGRQLSEAHIRVYTRNGQIVPDQCDVIGHDGVIYCRVLSDTSDDGMEWQTAHNRQAVAAELSVVLDAAWLAANPDKPNVFDRGLDEPEETPEVAPVVAPTLATPTVNPAPVAGVPAGVDLAALIAQAVAVAVGKDSGKGKGKGKTERKERAEHIPEPKMEFKTIQGRNGDFRKLVVDDGRTFNPIHHAQLSARHCALILANEKTFMGMVRKLAAEATE
jgi:hypothetical protein